MSRPLSIENLRDVFKREVDSSLSIDELADNEDFTDFGIDSLDLSSIFLTVEDDFDVKVLDEDIESLQTLNDLLAYINAHQ